MPAAADLYLPACHCCPCHCCPSRCCRSGAGSTRRLSRRRG
jgi:hypothetical protein